MKYFIWFVVVLACVSAGGFGSFYIVSSNFEAMTNVTWTKFVEGNAHCKQLSGEDCGLYGGFAPPSQFRKPQGTAL